MSATSSPTKPIREVALNNVIGESSTQPSHGGITISSSFEVGNSLAGLAISSAERSDCTKVLKSSVRS